MTDAWIAFGIFALTACVSYLVIHFVFERRLRKRIDKTGGYRLCRDYQHWLDWVARVEYITANVAEPMGLVLKWSGPEYVGQYNLYLYDPSFRPLWTANMFAGNSYDPEAGDKRLAHVITTMLKSE